MDTIMTKKCGCKGIRTCLMCEKDINLNENNINKTVVQFVYCPLCNLCWPSEHSKEVSYSPLYLGKIKLFLNFLTEEEESFLVNEIDKIPWVLSQSGRRKQRLTRLEEDFRPVELCHLEYRPEKGSAIEPHIDDSWIWGERLVTINLGSPTVLTLSVAKDGNCLCLRESLQTAGMSPLASLSIDGSCVCLQESCSPVKGERDCSRVRNLEETPVRTPIVAKHGDSDCLQEPLLVGVLDKHDCDRKTEEVPFRTLDVAKDGDDPGSDREEGPFRIPLHECGGVLPDHPVDMCGAFRRSGGGESPVEVRVVLPRRSLLVLAGCARHNWFHAIHRGDVGSRRLAMTFRELADEFLPGGPLEELGGELLTLGTTFY